MSNKRSHDEIRADKDNSNDEESDDDFGPMPVSANMSTDEGQAIDESLTKKLKKASIPSHLQKIYLDNLPKSSFYEHSFMHRDIVTHIAVSKPTEFIITASLDGHVKFWKKMRDNIEFVKHYQAHLGPINCLELSPDSTRLITTSEDKMIKFFEVLGFDLSHMIGVSYTPTVAVWLKTSTTTKVAIADAHSGFIRIYRTEDGSSGDMTQPLATLENLHQAPIKAMVMNIKYSCVISVDVKGMIEYWNVDDYQLPTQGLKFRYKSETDLYELAKSKTKPCSISLSETGDNLVIVCMDKVIRLFDVTTGKLKRKYDESVKVYKDSSKSVAVGGLDSLEMGRREAIERELEASHESLSFCNAVFDDSSNYLIYGTLLGIKVVNILDNQVVQVIGLGESGGERFLHLALYQGVPKVDAQYLLSKGTGGDSTRTVEQLHAEAIPDPTLFCTSFKKRRFYCFSRREPNELKEPRDVFNEMPTEEEKMSASSSDALNKSMGREAIIHTRLGDIEIKLFSNECPKTIENFCTHAKKGYYNNLIFHRVIKGFMVQTGDPKGDGTGGESIWGGEFEDEFVKTLKHDRPFTVSMANAGPNTNGSQFFITTVPTPWLDNKHTVFGRVTKGFQVVTTIENMKVNKHDKPYDEIKIMSIDIRS